MEYLTHWFSKLEENGLSRRTLIKLTGLMGLGGLHSVLAKHQLPVAAFAKKPEYRNYKPDSMAYRRFGKTNFMVSNIALGGAAGKKHGVGPSAESNPTAYRELLEKLIDSGVNYFDTSRGGMSDGYYDTESHYAWLCKPENREKVFISTKVDNASASAAKASVENSLKAMGTDCVDLVYLHAGIGVKGTDYSGALACFDALEKLKEEGKIRFMGMTAHKPDILTGLLNSHSDRVDAVMGFYYPTMKWKYLNGKTAQESAYGSIEKWAQVFSLAKKKDVGVVAMKVLMSPAEPWEVRKKYVENDIGAWNSLKPLVDGGASIPQACIRWALNNQDINTAVLGMRTVKEAEEDLGSVLPEKTGLFFEKNKNSGVALKIVPNPFTHLTTIHFDFPGSIGDAKLFIVSLSGRLIKDFSTSLKDGRRHIIWDGYNTRGRRVSDGKYVLVGQTKSGIFSQSLFLKS